jgi:hypothetical protein
MDPVSLVVSVIVSTLAGQIVRAVSPKQKRVSEQQRRVLAAQKPVEQRVVDSPLSQSADPGGPQIGILGRRRVGGRVVLSAKAGATTHMIILIAGSPTTVNAIYLNNGLIARNVSNNVTTSPWAGSGATLQIQIYDGSQIVADPTLTAAFPGWTASMVGRNQTYARISITPGTNTAYESDTPDFTFDVSGFRAYDPRNGAHNIADPSTWSVTTNAAIIAANYLISDLGRRLPTTSVDWNSVIAAADVCDELVPLASGLSEMRYACSAYWLTNESHESVIARIELAMAGHVYFLGDKYRVDAGMFDATGAPTITPNDYIGDGLAWADTPPIDQIANGVRGRFASPSNNFELRDFPAYQDSAALAQDGIEHWLDVDFEYVTSFAQAQRLARIAYNKTRFGYAATVDVRFAWFDTCRGDVIVLNDPLAGINTTFRVEGDEVDPDFGIEFDLAHETASFWAWTATTDERAMPDPVSLGVSGAGGVGVDPDVAGALQPPGATFHGVFASVNGGGANEAIVATVHLGPSARATHWEFKVPDSGFPIDNVNFKVSPNATASFTLTLFGGNTSTVGNVQVRSVVLATGEVSAWNSLNIPTLDQDFDTTAPDTTAGGTSRWVFPPPRALQIASLGTGSAVLNYFAMTFPRTGSIEIWRNTSNTTVGATLVGTYSNANGSITETQTPGSTFYYFARLVSTSPARNGPWSNPLLVAF